MAGTAVALAPRPFLILCAALLKRSAAPHFEQSAVPSSSLGPVSLCPGCTSALGLLCNPKYSNQYRLNNPVPLIKRHRSLTEAVLISFGSTSGFPKTL